MGIKRGMDSESAAETEITEDEAELYDRQIRLWGIESQKRLRESRVLIAGLGGLGAEIAKNLSLAGVKSITLLDKKKVQPDNCTAQFLVTATDVSQNRAQASEYMIRHLNPHADVTSLPEDVGEKSEEYFADFDAVCLTDCSKNVLLKVNEICRKHRKKFFCGETWGLFGYCFVDLSYHSYLRYRESLSAGNFGAGDEPPSKKLSNTKKMEKLEFGSLAKALSCRVGKAGVGLHKKMSKVFFLVHILLNFQAEVGRYPHPSSRKSDLEVLKSIRTSTMENLGFDCSKVSDDDLSYVFGEISPSCAVVGGVMAQEVIKAICADRIPLRNFFLFDGDVCSGVVENVG